MTLPAHNRLVLDREGDDEYSVQFDTPETGYSTFFWRDGSRDDTEAQLMVSNRALNKALHHWASLNGLRLLTDEDLTDLLGYFGDETRRADSWEESPHSMRASLKRWKPLLDRLEIDYNDPDEQDDADADAASE